MPIIERLKGPIFELFDWITGNGLLETVIISFFAVAVIIFVVFPIRECGRGYVAKLLGDDTAEREGRLTLNPISHIDPLGALFLCLSCFGWSKTMPVNINRCTKVKSRTAVVLTSLAGPVANILMAYVFMIIYKIVLMSFSGSIGTALSDGYTEEAAKSFMVIYYVMVALGQIIQLNIWLAILSLLPVPWHDGCVILCSFLPRGGVRFFERYGQIIHYAFLFVFLMGYLDTPLLFLSGGVTTALNYASFFLGVW